MKIKLLAATLISTGICSLSAADFEQGTEHPLVEKDSLGITIDAPISEQFIAMNVRIYTQDGDLIFQYRSLGERVNIPTTDLADGEYRYESVSIIATDDAEESEMAKRNFGSFKVENGELQAEQTPLGDELTHRLEKAAGQMLNWLIPSAHAEKFTDLEIEDNTPFIDFDDLGSGAGSDWAIAGYNGNYGVWDYNNVAWAFRIDRTASNSNSIRVNSLGDLMLANNAVTIDRSSPRLGIGTTTPNYELDISDTNPEIRLFDETDSSAVHLEYDSPKFRIEGNSEQDIVDIHVSAPESALVISSNGSVGVGTAIPQNHLHLLGNGATTTLGFGDKSGNAYWNVNSGGQGLWFSNQATGGGTAQAAFKISREAGNDALVVHSSDNIGIGTDIPSAALEILRFDGTAKFVVNEASAVAAPRTLFTLSNRGNTKFSLTNTDAAVEWAFANPGTGFRVSRQGSGVVEFDLLNNGNLTIAGTLTENSDRHAKTNIVDIDAQEVLQKVAALPIQQWQYKDALGENHIGPMAQDFYAAFGLGGTDKGISTLDSAGVALTAIQALAMQSKDHAEENNRLKTDLAAVIDHSRQLETDNHQLRAKVEHLEQQTQRLLQLERLVLTLYEQNDNKPQLSVYAK